HGRGGGAVEPGRQILNQSGIPTYDSPDRAIRAFMYLVSYRRNREILYETPRQISLSELNIDENARPPITDALAAAVDTLTKTEAKSLLAAFGIPTSAPRSATTAAD